MRGRLTIKAPALLLGKSEMTAPAATPPSTIAPSPPITTRPSRAGRATQRAARRSGAARASVLVQEKDVPKPAL
mgnify:CR=1 FL=1